MKKLGLIIKREYLARVTKWSFILGTLLTPIAIGLFMIIAGFIMTYEGDTKRHIAVMDSGNILGNGDTLNLEERRGLTFEKVTGNLEDLKNDKKYNAVLELPPITDLNNKKYEVLYHSSEGVLGVGVISQIEGDIERNIYQYKAKAFGFDQEQLKSLRTSVNLERKAAKDEDDEAVVSKTATITATVIGGGMGFIMYFVIFLYGMMVMRSITEEKTNRIVEVMISSVKPFQLMLGKIIGVGLVSLTQLAIWGILIPIIVIISQLLFGVDAQQMQDMNAQMSGADVQEAQSKMAIFLNEFTKQNWGLIIPMFVIFFLGGFFMYASLFAAVGSAMGDDLGESQSLTLPITLPVLVAFYIMFNVVQNPNSSLATWSSMVPFFSPIVMPARLAFNPPWWEIILSVLILIGSVIFFIWLSARIYRVGILMYGKKVSFKELGKWIFYKD